MDEVDYAEEINDAPDPGDTAMDVTYEMDFVFNASGILTYSRRG